MKTIVCSLFALMLLPLSAVAQFRVVDADTHEPLPGAYVFDSHGQLADMSDKDGMVKKARGLVTVSLLSYESQKVDLSKHVTEVALIPMEYSLPEVEIGRTEYVKTSGVFRDYAINNGKLVLYREGIVDFYMDCKSKDYTRRVRGCRQWSDRRLFKKMAEGVDHTPCHTFDFSKVHKVKTDGVTGTKGDTVYIKAKGGDDNAIMEITDTLHERRRHVIDGTKTGNPNELLWGYMKIKANISDWTFTDRKDADNSLIAFHGYQNYIINEVEVVTNREFVVTDVVPMSKADAKAEMKDKTEDPDFILPEVLPKLGFSIVKELQDMEATGLIEDFTSDPY